MKILLLILPLLLNAQWTFTKAHYDALTPAQMNVIDVSYLVGEEHSLGLTLASIALVETRADVSNDRNPNHICGWHQLDTRYASVGCQELESNPYLSASSALENLLFWKRKYPTASWRQILIYYNGGDVYPNPHGKEYVRRITQVYNILKANYDY